MKKDLQKFKKGGTWFLSKQQYKSFLEGKEYMGRPDGQFVIPTVDADKISDEFLRYFEKKLGLKKNTFKDGKGLVRIDVKNIEKYNPRLPEGKESGVNKFWKEGGETSGGISEALINPVHYKDAVKKGLFSIIAPSMEDWKELDTYPIWIGKKIDKIKQKEKIFYFKGSHFLYKVTYDTKGKREVFRRFRERWRKHLDDIPKDENSIITHNGQKYDKIKCSEMAKWVSDLFKKEKTKNGLKAMSNKIKYYKGKTFRYIIITDDSCKNNKYYRRLRKR